MMKTLEEILKAEYVSDIFEKENLKKQFHEYLKTFHPDLHPGNKAYIEATQKINILYNRACMLISGGKWEERDTLYVEHKNGKKFVVKYSYKKDFELGSFYVCRTKIIYLLDKKFKKYYDNFDISRLLKEVHPGLRDSFKEFLPKLKYKFENKDNYVVIFDKSYDLIPLSCLLDFYNQKIPDKCSAWIISRLLNLCCFFKISGFVQCGIDPENIFVSPEKHNLVIYGGWWYSKKIGEKLLGISQFVYSNAPIYCKTSGLAREDLDLQSVRSIAKKINGWNKILPKPIQDWENSGSSVNSVEEFSRWEKALTASYGERKFFKSNFDYNKFYK